MLNDTVADHHVTQSDVVLPRGYSSTDSNNEIPLQGVEALLYI